jgi:hypothetical protein
LIAFSTAVNSWITSVIWWLNTARRLLASLSDATATILDQVNLLTNILFTLFCFYFRIRYHPTKLVYFEHPKYSKRVASIFWDHHLECWSIAQGSIHLFGKKCRSSLLLIYFKILQYKDWSMVEWGW